jgi:hypothetical protein
MIGESSTVEAIRLRAELPWVRGLITPLPDGSGVYPLLTEHCFLLGLKLQRR